MIKINGESELKSRLIADIEGCGKEILVLQGGHFPLLYLADGAIEGIKQWGEFSLYSLELVCELGKFAQEIGREVEFVIIADA